MLDQRIIVPHHLRGVGAHSSKSVTAQSPSKIYKNLYNNQIQIDLFQKKICATRSVTLLQIIHQLLLILNGALR